MAFMSSRQLEELGFASCGDNVMISDKVSIYNAANIRLGNNVRIDDYCVLSAGEGGIIIGDYVHIAINCSLIGKGKITLEDFSGLSSRVAVYSSNDDYTGEYLTNPTVPAKYTNVHHEDVFLGKHVIVGAGSIILPGVRVEEGVAVGALSLISKDCKPFGVYLGNRKIGDRSRNLLDLEKKLRDEEEQSA